MKTAVALLRFVCSSFSPPPVKRKKGTSGGWLPWWCVFLGWFLLLSLSAVSTYFTLLYGFQYGRERSIKWVMSLGLSLFQSIFILQPLKVIPQHLGQVFFFSWNGLKTSTASQSGLGTTWTFVSLLCLGTQVVGIAVVFALLLKPVAVEESEEIEQVLLGKRSSSCFTFQVVQTCIMYLVCSYLQSPKNCLRSTWTYDEWSRGFYSRLFLNFFALRELRSKCGT